MTTSSSSIAPQTIIVQNAQFVCICDGLDSIRNPATGAGAGVSYTGTFDSVDVPVAGAYSNIKDAHVAKGGLKKTSANRGMLIGADASQLFSTISGMVKLRLSLPSAISSGIYAPLAGETARTLTDMVLWAANIGDHYITQPGLYAAFTPLGIEFSIWTTEGKKTIVAQTGSSDADVDVILEFAWSSAGDLGSGSTMIIYMNNVVVASGSGDLVDDDLDNLYTIDGVAVDANFTVLDSLSGKNGLLGTLRRLEVHDAPGTLPSGMVGGGNTPLPRLWSLGSARSEVEIPITFEVVRGGAVLVEEPDFMVAVPVTINLQATGPAGSIKQSIGVDAGVADSSTTVVPETPEDLPVGFEEVRAKQ